MEPQTYIKRIIVEDGYLDGLDLTFSPGLNTLIGPRGCGKTSIIELIRYALRLPHLSRRRSGVRVLQAEAVLEGGRVTVQCVHQGKDIFMTRSESDAQREYAELSMVPALIFSQGEIEDVGVNPASRLSLLDGFLDTRHPTLNANRIASVSSEIEALRNEISEISERVAVIPQLQAEIDEATIQQKVLLPSLEAVQDDKIALAELSRKSANLVVERESLERALKSVQAFINQLEGATTFSPNFEHSTSYQESTLVVVDLTRMRMSTAIRDISTILMYMESSAAAIREHLDVLKGQYSNLEGSMRELRRKIDGIEAGAGKHARTLQMLQERIASLGAIKEVRTSVEERLSQAIRNRDNLLDQVEQSKHRLFEERANTASLLNRELAPRIRVTVEESGLLTGYESSLSNVLRGSRMHLGALIPLIVSTISPRELIDLVDRGDAKALKRASNISIDRARSLMEYLSRSDLSELMTLPTEDRVEFELLDGPEYKMSDALSTGQRCTVVLPILTSRHGMPLIIDQPEDNLDNAFIVDTLVKSITARRKHDQMIVATHNPNIPVLGDADLVISLGSDGRRGFVRSSAPLEAQQTVYAIENVMEGGEEAFHRRAAFYAQRAR